MRKLLLAVLVVLPLMTLAASPETITLDVRKMTCAVCPITVKKSLEKVPGVSDVKVDFVEKTVTVTFDPDKTNSEAMTTATTNAGYPSTVHK